MQTMLKRRSCFVAPADKYSITHVQELFVGSLVGLFVGPIQAAPCICMQIEECI